MKINVLLLLICAVSDFQCVQDSRQEYTRTKRAKYYYPSKFFKLPPSSSQIMGPFSYTPPPGYMTDSGPPSANLRGYKVSKKPNNGLGDEDINNLFKYLSKQDLNKILKLAVEKDRLTEYRNYELGNTNNENLELNPFSKDYEEDTNVQDSRYNFNIKNGNIQYSEYPNSNSHQDSLQRIPRNPNGHPIDNFDYPKRLVRNFPVSDNFDSSYAAQKTNFNYDEVSARNNNNPSNENFDYPQENGHYEMKPTANYYSQSTTQNLHELLNDNLDHQPEETKIYNGPQLDNFNHQQGKIKNYNSYTNDVKIPHAINKYYDSLQNNYNIKQTLFNGDSTSQEQILYLDKYIQKEMSYKRPDVNMNYDSTDMEEEILPSPSNLREQEYEVSFTNNIPQFVHADSSPYRAENFANLPLMNYDSKLDTVNSYNVPHYTVTQVKNRQQAAVQSPQIPDSAKPTIELAPSRSAGRDQSDAHLTAIKIWTHKSKGMAYTLHDDGTLSPERPIRSKFKSSP